MSASGHPGGGRPREAVCNYKHSGLFIDVRRDGCVACRAVCIGGRLQPSGGRKRGNPGLPHHFHANAKSCYRE